MTSTSDRLRNIATAIETRHGMSDAVVALHRLADELPPEHPTGGSDQHLAELGIPEVLWQAVRADLAMVDALEQRMTAMPWPEIGRPEHTAARPLAHLFQGARGTIVQWYAYQWRKVTTMPPGTFLVPGRVD